MHFNFIRTIDKPLQSARSVWRQRIAGSVAAGVGGVAICTERVEAKVENGILFIDIFCCNLHGACGGKVLCVPAS